MATEAVRRSLQDTLDLEPELGQDTAREVHDADASLATMQRNVGGM